MGESKRKLDYTVGGYAFSEGKLLLILHSKLQKWLPVGGHIELNEATDDALKREFEEETGLEIEILLQNNIPLEGNVSRNLAMPFYINIHSVGDHDHLCFFYACIALNPKELKINNELKNFRWVSKSELNDLSIPVDVRNIALKAFTIYELHSKI